MITFSYITYAFCSCYVVCHHPEMNEIRHAPHNDVSVSDGPHNGGGPIILFYIIITIVLQVSTIFNTVTCCTGL